jgi:hypothetical protein
MRACRAMSWNSAAFQPLGPASALIFELSARVEALENSGTACAVISSTFFQSASPV